MKYVPVLAESGWISEPLHVANVLMSHLFLSDHNQAPLYTIEVASFSWAIHKGGDNISDIIREVKTTLSNYFGKYFEQVTVEVSENKQSQDSAAAAIEIYLSFQANGAEYNIQETIKQENGVFVRTIDIVNYDKT